MRLIRYGEIENEKPGIELRGERYDCSSFFNDWDRDFLNNGGIKKLQDLKISEEGGFKKIGDAIRWGSPVARPGKIICVGLNYSDHAREAGMSIPAEPILFMKATNTLCGPFDDVVIPKNSTKTDWEVELGIIIDRDAIYLENKEEGENVIAGYCVINDLSEREFQLERNGQWVKGKSSPGFCPAGPYLVTKDEIDNVLNLKMVLLVNGVTRQNGHTSTMIFDPGYLVYYISQYMGLEAGDIISTGTPPGVGMGMNPATFLKNGDEVILEIDNLGRQHQHVKAYREQ